MASACSPTSAEVAHLRIRNLSKTFPGVQALKSVDLDVLAGEVHALVGANGSGKSTLIKVLAGVHRPDAGAVAAVRGEPFALGSVVAARRAGLRFVHQDPGLVLNLDATDNFALGRGYARHGRGPIAWSRQRDVVRSALHDLGFHFDVREPLGRLSAAQRTGVAIARAIHDLDRASALLVLDEPTASMPRPDVESLFDVVARVRELGVAVIYISHHLDEVFAVADRVTVLRDGRKVDTFHTAALDHRELVHSMVGTALDASHRTRPETSGSVALTAVRLTGKAVRGIDLSVRRGEVLGVAGITGSGRDELIPLLFGGRPRRGDVTVNGQPLPPMRPDLAVRASVGMVPADRRHEAMLPRMTVLENLTIADLGRYWRGFRLRGRHERSDAACVLREMTVQPPDGRIDLATLSGGNQQKVILGRWMRLEPAVLLLDEPTQGVDVGAKQEIYRLLAAAAAEGAAILVCSSDEEELEHLCHRVLVLESGRVCAELVGATLTASQIMHAALGAEESIYDEEVRTG